MTWLFRSRRPFLPFLVASGVLALDSIAREIALSFPAAINQPASVPIMALLPVAILSSFQVSVTGQDRRLEATGIRPTREFEAALIIGVEFFAVVGSTLMGHPGLAVVLAGYFGLGLLAWRLLRTPKGLTVAPVLYILICSFVGVGPGGTPSWWQFPFDAGLTSFETWILVSVLFVGGLASLIDRNSIVRLFPDSLLSAADDLP